MLGQTSGISFPHQSKGRGPELLNFRYRPSAEKNVLTRSIYVVNMHDGAAAHFSPDVRDAFSYHDKRTDTAGPVV